MYIVHTASLIALFLLNGIIWIIYLVLLEELQQFLILLKDNP